MTLQLEYRLASKTLTVFYDGKQVGQETVHATKFPGSYVLLFGNGASWVGAGVGLSNLRLYTAP